MGAMVALALKTYYTQWSQLVHVIAFSFGVLLSKVTSQALINVSSQYIDDDGLNNLQHSFLLNSR